MRRARVSAGVGLVAAVFAAAAAVAAPAGGRVLPRAALEATRAGSTGACYYQSNKNCNAVDANLCSGLAEAACKAAANRCTACSNDAAWSECKTSGALYKSCNTTSTADGCGVRTLANCVWVPPVNDPECGEIPGYCTCGDFRETHVACERVEVTSGTPCQ